MKTLKKLLFGGLALALSACTALSACQTQKPIKPDPERPPIVEPDPPTLEEGLPYDEAFGAYRTAQTTVTSQGMSVLVSTYNKFATTEKTKQQDVALYVVGHMEERIGMESDEHIIGDLLNDFIVVVCDYQQSYMAFDVTLAQSVMELKFAVMNSNSYLGGWKCNQNKVYTIPAGCRIARDICYFDLSKSASTGSAQYIVDVWNTSAVKSKVGSRWKQATTLDDIVLKNGDSLTKQDEDGNYPYLQYNMDIVYPSKPKTQTPVILNGSTSWKYRNLTTGDPAHADRPHYVEFLMKGYACVCYDHEYVPFMVNYQYGYGHINPDYSMCYLDGVKVQTAAVRCVKYYAKQFGYSTQKVGVFGHSKAAWCSCLSAQDPELQNEAQTYKDFAQGETVGAQPYLSYEDGTAISSNVTCVYYSMGFGSERYQDIVATSVRPTLIACGKYDEYNNWSYWADEVAAYEAADKEFIECSMTALGHTICPNEVDPTFGYNYHNVFQSFFDYYLKDLDPKVLYVSDNGGKLSAATGLFVQFCAPVQDVAQNMQLIDSNGAPVAGEWTPSRSGNRWTFGGELVQGQSYRLTIGKDIKDNYGKTLGVAYSYAFTVTT